MMELMGGGPVIDPVAIYVAITGGRRIELSRAERMIAAAFILAAGGRQSDVAVLLSISRAEACRLAARIKDAVTALPRAPPDLPARSRIRERGCLAWGT